MKASIIDTGGTNSRSLTHTLLIYFSLTLSSTNALIPNAPAIFNKNTNVINNTPIIYYRFSFKVNNPFFDFFTLVGLVSSTMPVESSVI